MTTEPALPWDPPPPADPAVRWAPTVYRDDPDSVVEFLTHMETLPKGVQPVHPHPVPPPIQWHLAADAGAYVDDGDDS